MKISFLIFLNMYFGILYLKGQQYESCHDPIKQYRIIKKDGAPLVVGWNNDSLIMIIPFGSIVTSCGQPMNDSTKILVYFRDTMGVLDFKSIKLHQSINVVFPHSLGRYNLPPAKDYYGIYIKKNLQGRNQTSIKKCKTKSGCQLNQEGEKIPVSRLMGNDDEQILISGLENIHDSLYSGELFDNKFIYPGEVLYWQSERSNNSYLVYAKGTIVENTDTAESSPFSGIRNYEFHIKHFINGESEDKILYNFDVRPHNAFQYLDGVYLNWMGDIDGDGKLDMILVVSHHHACADIVFYLSSQAEPGHLFKQVTKYTYCDC